MIKNLIRHLIVWALRDEVEAYIAKAFVDHQRRLPGQLRDINQRLG
jgi:hypothetical protein